MRLPKGNMALGVTAELLHATCTRYIYIGIGHSSLALEIVLYKQEHVRFQEAGEKK